MALFCLPGIPQLSWEGKRERRAPTEGNSKEMLNLGALNRPLQEFLSSSMDWLEARETG